MVLSGLVSHPNLVQLLSSSIQIIRQKYVLYNLFNIFIYTYMYVLLKLITPIKWNTIFKLTLGNNLAMYKPLENINLYITELFTIDVSPRKDSIFSRICTCMYTFHIFESGTVDITKLLTYYTLILNTCIRLMWIYTESTKL